MVVTTVALVVILTRYVPKLCECAKADRPLGLQTMNEEQRTTETKDESSYTMIWLQAKMFFRGL